MLKRPSLTRLAFYSQHSYNTNLSHYRCFTTDSLPRGYPGQLFGLRRITEFGGYAKRLTIYTGSVPRLGRVITLRPVQALAYLRRIAFQYRVCVLSFYNGYPHQPFIVQVLRGVVCVLLGYKVRVLSYALGAFPCIVRVGVSVLHVALLHVFLGNWAMGLVTKAHFPVVWSMGDPQGSLSIDGEEH